MKPVLPQFDPDRSARASRLEGARQSYQWDHDYLDPMPLLREKGTSHPNAWQAALGWEFGIIPKSEHPPLHYILARNGSLRQLKHNSKRTRAVWHESAFSSLDDYKRLFVEVPRPTAMADWPSDAAFEFQRLGGTNPVVLERVDAIPENFALRESQLDGLLPKGASLAGLAKSGRVYLCDYALLEGIPMGTVGGVEKYVPAPMGLFYLDDAGALKALAIQLGQAPLPESVVTPKDNPKAWLLAKTYFQAADINQHEMATHLCRTHFILEGFAVATARQLAANHPVAVLLAPHLRILIWNNFEGRELLLSSSGLATRLLAGGLAGSVEILKRSYLGHTLDPVGGHARKPIEGWTFESWDLPKALAARGVAGTSLPDYPYRDDGLLVWEAVEKFVSRYVRLYYASDEDVAKDDELQAWVTELAAPEGAHVPGITLPRTLDDLATILTRIIFACGPQHAAVNFPQYDMAAFAPNMPAAAFARPPQDPTTMDDPTLDAYLLQMLPSPAQAELQLQTVLKLTSYQYDRLGHYEEKDFKDPGALSLIAAFQEDLATVQVTITERNTKRVRPYPWFLPERITNSTSI